MKTTALALAAALAAGGLAHAQQADCNVNGIPDATEIAQGLVDDCNVNGIPDVCEYAGVMLEAEQSGFGNGSPLIATFTDLDPSISDVRLAIEVRADLDSVGEFVQVKLGGSVVTTLWVTGGQACPSEPQSQTVTVAAGTFNAALTNGTVVVSLEPSGVVSVKECSTSSASVVAEYISDLEPEDCLGTGRWDGCDIAADPLLDCDGNGIPDPCDIAADAFVDCDADGVLDQCAIAADSSLDCNANSVLDSCEIALGGTYFNYDCDSNGVHDACQINTDPALDENNDGMLDSCQYARGDFNLDLSVDSSDLGLLLGLWGTVNPPIGDLNQDGMLDGADLGILLLGWGRYTVPWGVVLQYQPDPAVVADADSRDALIVTGLPWRVIDNATGIELLLVAPGTFSMGCSPSEVYGCNSTELPVRDVYISQPFYLGRYEVTQSQWITIMGYNPSSFLELGDYFNKPVNGVSWLMAQAFASISRMRLPSEAEWEYACRAGTETAFSLPPNGTASDSALASIAWFIDNNGAYPSDSYGPKPVGGKLPNGWGFYDMHGNIWEWCNDWYAPAYYSDAPSIDPPGPSEGSVKVMRGGHWSGESDRARASARIGQGTGGGNANFGFRVARTP